MCVSQMEIWGQTQMLVLPSTVFEAGSLRCCHCMYQASHGLLGPSCLCLPSYHWSIGIIDVRYYAQLFLSFRGSSSGPRACIAGTLLTDPLLCNTFYHLFKPNLLLDMYIFLFVFWTQGLCLIQLYPKDLPALAFRVLELQDCTTFLPFSPVRNDAATLIFPQIFPAHDEMSPWRAKNTVSQACINFWGWPKTGDTTLGPKRPQSPVADLLPSQEAQQQGH